MIYPLLRLQAFSSTGAEDLSSDNDMDDRLRAEKMMPT